MDVLSVVRLLLRKRLLIALGLAISLGIAGAIDGVIPVLHSGAKPHSSGGATTRVLIDTPTALAATADAYGASTIQSRSLLVADTLASDEMTAKIAAAAGLRADEIVVQAP